MKKGFIPGPLVDFWAIVVFVLVIIIFSIIFVPERTYKQSIGSSFGEYQYIDSATELIAFLRAPASLNHSKMSVADLVVLTAVNESFKSALERAFKHFFKEIPKRLIIKTEKREIAMSIKHLPQIWLCEEAALPLNTTAKLCSEYEIEIEI